MPIRTYSAASTIVMACVALASASRAEAQTKEEAPFDLVIEAQPLDAALLEVSRITGREILFSSDLVANRRSERLAGRLSAEDATAQLLRGTGLTFRRMPGAIIIVGAPEASAPAPDLDVVVTGSRIRGNSAASPVLVLRRDAIENAGQTDLGEVARSLPQSFSGGQNPGVGVGASGASNVNLNASSSLNLRGLGPDATLTLLNGHRLAYDGAAQAVDISAIPLSAIERLEIVPDGASALYGSDAVGGVANVILRRDFQGFEASTRFAGATAGGSAEQEFRALAGTTWSTGNVLAAYSYDQSTAILARQRDVASDIAPSTILVWPQNHHNLLVNGQQRLTGDVLFSADALFSARAARGRNPFTATGTVLDYGSTNETRTTSFAFAPKLDWSAGAWNLSGSAVYSEDNTRFDTTGYFNAAVIARFRGCQCNSLASGELGAEGPLFALPGGSARVALGGGYRTIRLHSNQEGIYDVTRRRGTEFAYGEVSLPFVGAANGVPLVRSLTITVAGRFEHYAGAKSELTPKVGLVYTPLRGIDLRASWGRSFKAPTLYQQFSPSEVDIFRTVDLGYAGYPAGSTIALVAGGQSALKPERAETWSAGVALAPLSRLTLSLNYFNTRFTNRVQTPIQSLFGALSNPLYAQLITLDPTASQLATIVSQTSSGVIDQTGGSYDPASVVAIIDSRYVNVASERIRGLDAMLAYAIPVGGGDFDFSINATRLTSDRQLTEQAPRLQLAGTLFNPPHLRVRGGASWSGHGITTSLFANRIGGVDDLRVAPAQSVDGLTTIDLALKLAPEQGPLRKWAVLVSAQNLFDTQPSRIRSSFAYATPYDSTNYSVVGRFVSATVTRRW